MRYILSWNKDLSATMEADGWHSDTPSLQQLLQCNHPFAADANMQQRSAHAYKTAKALGAHVKKRVSKSVLASWI